MQLKNDNPDLNSYTENCHLIVLLQKNDNYLPRVKTILKPHLIRNLSHRSLPENVSERTEVLTTKRKSKRL